MENFQGFGSLSLKLPKNICCTACHQQFAIKDFTTKCSRQPLLLHCGHSLCESCLLQNLATMNYTCGQCGHVTNFEHNPQTNEYLPLNFYIIGYLTTNQNQKYERHKKLSLLAQNDIDFNYSIKGPQQTLYACEECSQQCCWFCDICKTNFCEICWIKVHSSAKSLMKHQKVSIQGFEQKNENFFGKCSKHESRDLDFYCRQCDIAVCSHCVILQHQGQDHNPVTLKEKNMEMANSVKTAAEEAEIICKRMKQTLEKIKLTLPADIPEGISFDETESQITRNFARLHGILQLEEAKLLKELRDAANGRDSNLSDLRSQLETQVEKVTSLLRHCEVAVKNPRTSDFVDLHKKLLDVKQLPCYLISQKNVNEELKVTFDESLLTSVKNYCNLKIPKQESFELCSAEDLPEDYQVEPLRSDTSDVDQTQSIEPNESEVESLSGFSHSEIRKSDSDSYKSKSVPPEGKKCLNIFEGKFYTVRVTYIKNPGEFYVLPNSQKAKWDLINRKSMKFGNSSNCTPTHVSKDEIYLVKYTDGKWYRGKIIEVLVSDKEQNTALVYYLDYGNKEKVPFSRLRPIPEELLEESPLAIKCKLFDCVPRNGDWCAEATEKMEKILNNCLATMYVKHIHPDCLEIDLSRANPKGPMGREIISVRDTLLFLKLVSILGGYKNPNQQNFSKYLDQILPGPGETFQAVITHVNSPSDFFVKKVVLGDSYAYKLDILMQSHYFSNVEKGKIHSPFIGMPCAALYTEDERWYRAKIVDIPDNERLTVFYVDYGNQETIFASSVRKLKNTFAKHPPMAIRCCLVENPNSSTSWNSQTISYFKENVEKQFCQITVQEKRKKEGIRVFLYFKVNKKEVCVNELLCSMNNAPDTLDILNFKNPEEIILSEITPSWFPENTKNKKSNKNVSCKEKMSKNDFGKDKKKPSAQKLRELHANEKISDHTPTEDTISENSAITNNKFKIKVDILSAASPSCIYVTFAALESVFNDSQAKLQEFYQNSEYSDCAWTVGSKCAVYSDSKNGWYRASVTKILPDNKVKVFLKDIALESLESIFSLRPLEDSFSSYGPCAVKCHLSDIQPVGDEWPGISCEFLQSEIENYKEIYMTKKGQIEDKSVPVELWVEKILHGGALEPTIKEWVTLNRLLVQQGVAIPAKSKLKLCGQMYNEKEKEINYDGAQEEEVEFELEEEEKEEENKVKEKCYIPSLSSHWLPPKKLKNFSFIGIPTYVDCSACIYVHDIEDEDTLKRIRESLAEEYENSKPSPEDHFWTPGQLCIVKYHLDNFWYRGVILKVNENLTYDVLFIDYGNVETSNASALRKRIKLHEIPTLVHKFQLQGVLPISEDGRWPTDILDQLHSFIVEKPCKINVVLESSNWDEPSLITLQLQENDVDVGNFMIAEGLAQAESSPESCYYFNEDDVIVESVKVTHPQDKVVDVSSSKTSQETYEEDKDGEIEELPLQYKSLEIPEDLNEFYINITNVESLSEIYGNLVNKDLPKKLTAILKRFEVLEKELMNKCPQLPKLEEFRGQPCCCLNTKENKWCRAEIEAVKGGKTVCVFYVDYGYKEYLKKSLLRVCLKEWLDLPKMAIKLKLSSIEQYPDIHPTACTAALNKCLKETVLEAKAIKKQEDCVEVELFKDDELAYKELIEDEFFYQTTSVE